ncbi:SRPBCC family protein [Streptomyces sp. NPDC005181]|uniref:SRPBCC family protein n=1 Tax=Streptomyces sp. NPDC005181 TaxID=3156869 RepID=UPI0033B9D630
MNVVTPRRLLVVAAIVGSVVMTASGLAAAAAHVHTAQACRNAVIDATAPVITRDDILIRAPRSTVWAIQTDVENWPDWQPGVTAVRRADAGKLRVGSAFTWDVEGLHVTSTVRQVEPGRRIVWGGTGNGITAVHVWTFTPPRDGVLVHTEESWQGAPVDADVPTAQAALDASLRAWLENLKQVSEAQTAPGR